MAIVAYIYNLDSRHCHLCNQLVEIFPSIDTAASIALADSKVIRIVWLYYTVTTPFVYLSGIPAVFDLKLQKPASIGLRVSVIAVVGLLVFMGINVFLNGGHAFLDEPERFLVHTVVGGWAWSFATFFTLCVHLVLMTGIIFMIFKRLRGY